MNLAEIQSAARSIIVDVTSDVESGLLRSIQRAQRELELKTFCPDQESVSIYLCSKSYTNSGDGYFDFASAGVEPQDFIRLATDPFLISFTAADQPGTAIPLIRVTAAESKQLQTDAGGAVAGLDDLRGVPKYFSLVYGVLAIYPLPDDNSQAVGGNYVIRIPYYKHLPALTSSNDTNWFTNNVECAEYLIFRAAEDGLRLIRDPLFATYRQLAMERKVSASRAAKRRTWSIDDHIDVNISARIGSYRV